MRSRSGSSCRALRSAVRSADGKELLRKVDAAAAEQAVRSGDRAALADVFRRVIATPEGCALAEKIRKANCTLVAAIEDYTEGKKSMRFHDYGNLAFHHAIDALVTVDRFTQSPLHARVNEQIDRINEVRGVSTKVESEKHILADNYGPKHARMERNQYNEAHPEAAPAPMKM